MAEREKCAYCGARNKSVSTHSGILECDKCWYWRKLDGPAHTHWARVTKEFLSNVDAYDWTEFGGKIPDMTMEEFREMLTLAIKFNVGLAKMEAYEIERRSK